MIRVETNKHRKNMYQAQKYIAKNLRLLRALKGVSQEKLADTLHMSRACYSSLESGSKTPDFITIYMLAEFYDISLDYLLAFDISEHILSLLQTKDNETNSAHFIVKYLQLSRGARKQIRTRLKDLIAKDAEYNYFPWDYKE